MNVFLNPALMSLDLALSSRKYGLYGNIAAQLILQLDSRSRGNLSLCYRRQSLTSEHVQKRVKSQR